MFRIKSEHTFFVFNNDGPKSWRNQGRPFKRLLEVWYRNGPTSGPTSCQLDDDDDVFSPENRAVYEIMWKNVGAGEATDDNMAQSLCVLDT